MGLARDTLTGVRQLPALALDTLLPPRCLACGVNVARGGALCADCWAVADFIAPPYCHCCGLPFAYAVGEGALCAGCAAEPPDFDQARAVFRYDDSSRRLVLGFKHGDRTEGGPAYAEWLGRAGQDLLDGSDVIAPVPLHWRRLLSRRFNQAALLSQALGRQSGLPVCPDLLQRRRHTPPQGRLSRAARARNVRGAFQLSPRYREEVRDQKVLLVDDVMTTGATAQACAAVLKRAGANSVFVLVLARVVRAGDGV